MNKLKEIKGALFDMDGLLIDSERVWLELGKQISDDLALNIPYSFFYESVGRREDKTLEALAKLLGSQNLVDEFIKEYHNRNEAFIDNYKGFRKKGAIELLTYLKSNNYIIALCSSSYKNQLNKRLEQANISKDFFDYIISGDMVANPKPNPEIYLKACEILNLSPQQTIVLEDSNYGVEAGYSANCNVIFIQDIKPLDERTQKMVYAQCPSLLDVIDLLK